jgi:hypothetical protein
MKFLGIRGIEESWVYRDIFNKGRVMGAQVSLLKAPSGAGS